MAVAIKPFTEDLIPAVKELNSRLATGGAPEEFRFPERPTPAWLPKVAGRRIYQEYFLLVENDAVRGGYILKYQDFFFQGEIHPIGFLHWPVSEGIVNKAYAWVALQMFRNALKTQPLMYGLGFGGYDAGPLPRILEALAWNLCAVPFYFKVNRPTRFLREIRALRNTRARSLITDGVAATGIGGLALMILQGIRAKRCAAEERVEEISVFGNWADDLWDECKGRYEMISVRDSESLNILYPTSSKRFLRFKVTRGSAALGWAVLLDTTMQDDNYFGNMRVGSIVDCVASPENASAVIRGVTRVLEERGVDLIVSNQLHAAWCTAFRESGFLPGPSNFLFGASKELSQILRPFGLMARQVHMTRGDGDGPVHL